MNKYNEYQSLFDQTNKSIHNFYWDLTDILEFDGYSNEDAKKILELMLNDLILECMNFQDGFIRFSSEHTIN